MYRNHPDFTSGPFTSFLLTYLSPFGEVGARPQPPLNRRRWHRLIALLNFHHCSRLSPEENKRITITGVDSGGGIK